jgi:regulator of RNase E activity RraA
MDGLVRDIKRIRNLQFPVFHGGIGPLDSRGRAKMVLRDVAIELCGVAVKSHDYVFGDADGVVIIPEAIADDVFRLAFEKVEAEDNTRERLENGVLLSNVFEEFGVL